MKFILYIFKLGGVMYKKEIIINLYFISKISVFVFLGKNRFILIGLVGRLINKKWFWDK